MTNSDTRNIRQLFREWRQGDKAAGSVMAQRFADWYYAVATSRLGEARGSQPCQVACQRFGEGVVEVRESRNLVPWAHGLLKEELAKAGDRATDGDEPNAYTGNQRPKALLARVRQSLPGEVALLEAVYGRRTAEAEVQRLAAPFGGHPVGVLHARYAVKRWLRDQAGLPMQVAPETPVLDRAPLPLYECAGMAGPEEEATFEQWMITDLDLCRDVAEFSQFALALRGGLPAAAPVVAPAAASASAAPASASRAPTAAAAPETGGSVSKGAAVGGAVLVVGVVGLVGLVAALALAFWLL